MTENGWDPRRALQVTRYHTWDRVREQSVGEHSMQVMRIVLAIMPDAPRYLLIHCLTHDVGEIVSGDPPYPVKKNYRELKDICERIERDAHLSMCIPWSLPGPQKLSETDYATFKLAEFIEMWEWALFEMGLGNRRADLVRARCWDAMAPLMAVVEPAVNSRASNYLARRLRYEGQDIPSSPVLASRAARGSQGGNGEGRVVQRQLEEARGSGRVHDAGAQVGSSGTDG